MWNVLKIWQRQFRLSQTMTLKIQLGEGDACFLRPVSYWQRVTDWEWLGQRLCSHGSGWSKLTDILKLLTLMTISYTNCSNNALFKLCSWAFSLSRVWKIFNLVLPSMNTKKDLLHCNQIVIQLHLMDISTPLLNNLNVQTY